MRVWIQAVGRVSFLFLLETSSEFIDELRSEVLAKQQDLAGVDLTVSLGPGQDDEVLPPTFRLDRLLHKDFEDKVKKTEGLITLFVHVAREKTFAFDGVPPLRPRVGSASEASVNLGHLPADIKESDFNAFEGLKLRATKGHLWTRAESNKSESIIWASESDVQGLVEALLQDAFASLGLARELSCLKEITIFNTRPDIWLVLEKGIPIGVVEVKVPTKGIMDNSHVHGQIFDYMVSLKSFFGLHHVFGLVSTYESSRIYWFPTSTSYAAATERVEIESKDPQFIEWVDTDPGVQVEKKAKPKRNLECSRIIPWNDPQFSKLLGTMILKMYDARHARGTVRLIDSERPYLWINEESWEWHTTTFSPNFRLHHGKLPTAGSLILLRDLGGPRQRVWQVCSASGVGCVLKFPGKDSTDLKTEFERWEKLEPKKARLAKWGGVEVLMMPFVHKIEHAAWTQDHHDAVKVAVSACVKKGLLCRDVVQHVGFTSPVVTGGKFRAMITDLQLVEELAVDLASKLTMEGGP